jgi:hypothetical protein
LQSRQNGNLRKDRYAGISPERAQDLRGRPRGGSAGQVPGQCDQRGAGCRHRDGVIGPAASIGLTIAPLVAATAYGSGAVILLTAVPMLVIANAYRRLNLWNANTGASFEWVGRAINPYLGFLTGFLMIAAYVIATVSGVEVLGPSVLAVFGANSTSTWANISIGTAVGVMLPDQCQATWPLSRRTRAYSQPHWSPFTQRCQSSCLR